VTVAEPTAPGATARPSALVVGRFGPVVASSIALVAVATTGYVVIAGYSWFDALYMTVITLGTIGYQEVEPLGTDGRVWTIAVVGAGFCLLVYVASVLTSLFVSGDLGRAFASRRGARMRSELRDHVIVVGFGRVGRATAGAVLEQSRGCIVVDTDPASLDGIEELGAVALTGDGRDEHVLRSAGIERATALVAAAHDDATNMVVVLTARSIAPGLRVVARVNDPQWDARMRRAGADACTSPYESVGALLATSAVEPGVIGLQDLPGLGLRTEEIAVDPGSAAVGRELPALLQAHPDVLLLGVRTGAGVSSWTEVAGGLRPHDVVLALGAPASLRRLTHELSAPPSRPEGAPRLR
jgi:voltage-gated potassium channel